MKKFAFVNWATVFGTFTALAACAGEAPDEASNEDELAAPCEIGATCPRAIKVVPARPAAAVPREDIRHDLTVQWQGDPEYPVTFVSGTTSRLLWSTGRNRLYLSGGSEGLHALTVDDFLLVEVLAQDGARIGAAIVNPVLPIALDGKPLNALAPLATWNGDSRGWTYAPIDISALLPQNVPFRLRVGLYDVAGVALASDVYLSTAPPSLGLAWSHAGPIADKHCVRVNEPKDPHAWNDNFLCTDRDVGLRWSWAGPLPNMVCVAFAEPAEPAAHKWSDNYLCSPRDEGLVWSHAGPLAGKTCVQIVEPADPNTWSDNYLCESDVVRPHR